MSISIYRIFRPFRLFNQRCGMFIDPEEVFHAMTLPRILARQQEEFFRQPKYAAVQEAVDDNSTVTIDKNKFQANLDVQQFKPEEISVKISGDRTVTVEGKHEDNNEEKGHIFRHFVNKFVLPKSVDATKIESNLSSDGILTITAPTVEEEEIEQKSIPIMQTGKPLKSKSPEKTEEQS